MKICVAGKNNIAVDVCKVLIQKYGKENVCIIPNKSDITKNTFQQSLKLYAIQNEIEIVDLKTIYPLSELIFLSLEFDRIIDPEKFSSKRLFNIHFSLLPRYKGMYTSAWPLIQGESHTGVTLHCIDKGIDTGNIIAQQQIEITESDTSKSLYMKYIKRGTSLVLSQLDGLVLGTFTATKQPVLFSSYYGKKSIDYSCLTLNLQVTAWQLACQIRAFVFRDYQLPTFAGIPLVGSEICSTKSYQTPGTVLEDTETYFKISTVDYDIKLIKDHFSEVLEYCKNDDVDGLRQLGYIKNYLEEQNEKGWTPLMVAAYNNAKHAFYYLLSCGADINATNYKGTTVLMYAKDAALHYNDIELVSVLLDRHVNIEARDFTGKTVLDYLKDENNRVYQYIKNNR